MLALIAGLLAASLGVAAPPATAGIDLGADFVNVGLVDVECVEGQPLPCPPGAGVGAANTIHVRQSLVDGEWVYDTVVGTSDDPDDVWMQVSWEGDCNFGYSLIEGRVISGDYDDHGWWNTYMIEIGSLQHVVDGLPDANHHTTQFAMHHPVDEVLHASGFDFADPVGHLLQLAEAKVQDRIDAGMTEAEARAVTEVEQIAGPWHGLVACRGDVFGSEYFEADPTSLSLDVVFEGVEPEPGVVEPHDTGGLQVAPAIGQAVLVVQPAADDPCLVHASGTFVANQPMTVEYRVVNHLGQKSQLHSVEIGHTLVAHVLHEIAVPEVEDTAVDEQLGVELPVDGPLDAKAEIDSGLVSDVLHLEVVSPHAFTSNHEGYSVPPCSPTADPDGGSEREVVISGVRTGR